VHVIARDYLLVDLNESVEGTDIPTTAIIVSNVIGTGAFLKARVTTCSVELPGGSQAADSCHRPVIPSPYVALGTYDEGALMDRAATSGRLRITLWACATVAVLVVSAAGISTASEAVPRMWVA
jgi:hypothetical protein